MIQTESLLRVADNSGASYAQCIHTSKKNAATVGDRIVVSIKSIRNSNFNLKKGDVHPALIIRTKSPTGHKKTFQTSFGENAIILLNTKGEPLSSRIFGPLKALPFKLKKRQKIVSLGANVI